MNQMRLIENEPTDKDIYNEQITKITEIDRFQTDYLFDNGQSHKCVCVYIYIYIYIYK